MVTTEDDFLSSATGRELVLKLSEDYFNSLLRFPLGFEIARRFMTNEEINALVGQIIQKQSKGKDKREKKKRSMEDVIADYMDQIWRYEEYWKKAVKKGIDDGTISSNLTVDQLLLYIMVLISGVIDHMQMRRIPFEQVKLDYNKTREITLSLVENLLRN